MSGRRNNKFHRIRHLQTITGNNFAVTITKEAAQQFSGCCFCEVMAENGILLLKSGCDTIGKIKDTMVVGLPIHHHRIRNNHKKYFEQIKA